MRVTSFNVVIFLFLLSVRHIVLQKRFLIHLSIAIFLVYFAQYLVPGKDQGKTDYVACNDHYAIEIGKGERFQGSYLRCEDFDSFHELTEKREYDQARLLLFRPMFIKANTAQF